MTHEAPQNETDWIAFREASVALLSDLTEPAQAQAAIERDFALILASGRQPMRHFHSVAHYRDVASAPGSVDEMEANCSTLQAQLHRTGLMAHYERVTQLICRAGWHHDVVYAHIDDGILPEIALDLPMFVEEAKGVYTIRSLAEQPEAYHWLHSAALGLFGFAEGQRLHPHQGQNEFLSALYAARAGLRSGIAPRWILAEMAMIEGTIPFRSGERFELLHARLSEVNERLPVIDRLSEAELDAVIYGAVFMANHDVIGFRKPFEEFNRGSNRLLMEASSTLQTPQGMYRACTRLADFLGPISGCGDRMTEPLIFHNFRQFPPSSVRDPWDRAARVNSEVQQQRLRSYAAAAALVAAEAVRKGIRDAASLSFEQLFHDASLEPPDHIFPRAMHEIRTELDGLAIAAVLSAAGPAGTGFPVCADSAARVMDAVPDRVRHFVHRKLEWPAAPLPNAM